MRRNAPRKAWSSKECGFQTALRDLAGLIMLITLDLNELSSSEEQYDLWRSVTPSAYGVGHVPNGNGLGAVASFWSLDSMMMASRFAAHAHKTKRGAKDAGRSRKPYLKVRFYHSGSSQIYGEGSAYHLRPGDVHFIDQSRGWEAIHERHDQSSIFIPHDLVGYDPSKHPIVRTFPARSPEGRLLKSVIRVFYEELSRGETRVVTIIPVVKAALHGALLQSRDRDFVAARNRAIVQFSRDSDIDLELRSEALSRDFGVSRATIFRIFQDHGGLEKFRMTTRLGRARELLAGREAPRGEIGRVASGLGFSSTSHFSDAFLERFGVRPGDAARLPRVDTPPKQASANDPRDPEDTLRHLRTLYAPVEG